MFNKIKDIFETIKKAEYFRIKVNGQRIERINYDTYELSLPEKSKRLWVKHDEREDSYSFYWNDKDGDVIYAVHVCVSNLVLTPKLFPLEITKQMILDDVSYVDNLLQKIKDDIAKQEAYQEKQIQHRKQLECELFPSKKFFDCVRNLF